MVCHTHLDELALAKEFHADREVASGSCGILNSVVARLHQGELAVQHVIFPATLLGEELMRLARDSADVRQVAGHREP
jgi:hypothetical protein